MKKHPKVSGSQYKAFISDTHMSGLSGLGWVQVHSTSFSFSLDQQLITLMCSLGERRDHKRTKPTLQAHFKPLIVSCLLTYHWLIQVTLLSPKSKGRGTLSSHCEAVTRTWMCDATTEQWQTDQWPELSQSLPQSLSSAWASGYVFLGESLYLFMS